mgnify:CR=1 FL=1
MSYLTPYKTNADRKMEKDSTISYFVHVVQSLMNTSGLRHIIRTSKLQGEFVKGTQLVKSRCENIIKTTLNSRQFWSLLKEHVGVPEFAFTHLKVACLKMIIKKKCVKRESFPHDVQAYNKTMCVDLLRKHVTMQEITETFLDLLPIGRPVETRVKEESCERNSKLNPQIPPLPQPVEQSHPFSRSVVREVFRENEDVFLYGDYTMFRANGLESFIKLPLARIRSSLLRAKVYRLSERPDFSMQIGHVAEVILNEESNIGIVMRLNHNHPDVASMRGYRNVRLKLNENGCDETVCDEILVFVELIH